MRWVLAGQGAMGAAALAAVAARRPPGAVLTPEGDDGPVVVAAAAAGIAVERAGRADPARLAGLDAAVACCWGEVLGEDALAAPRHGWLNLHPSRLPAWRGADPVAWQLLAAPRALGLSVHHMTADVDAGPVLADGAVAVAAGDDRGALLARAGTALGALAADVLDVLASGAVPPERPQREEEATWCPPPGVVAAVEPATTRAGPAARVVRAFSPEPGAAVGGLAPGWRLAVPEVGPELGDGEAPGAVARLDDGRVAVACADRWLRGRAVPGPAAGRGPLAAHRAALGLDASQG